MSKERKEHNNELDAMRQALRILNHLLLTMPNLEETALKEAAGVSVLGIDNLDREELIDYLTQASIDYKANSQLAPKVNTFKTIIDIRDRDLVNLFTSACEGGSNYWCRELTPHGKGDPYQAMLSGFDLVDATTGKHHIVTSEDIRLAILLFPTKAPIQFADLLNEDDDATTGDVFLQLCVFGEVFYG